jgi:hypothetical protein
MNQLMWMLLPIMNRQMNAMAYQGRQIVFWTHRVDGGFASIPVVRSTLDGIVNLAWRCCLVRGDARQKLYVPFKASFHSLTRETASSYTVDGFFLARTVSLPPLLLAGILAGSRSDG